MAWLRPSHIDLHEHYLSNAYKHGCGHLCRYLALLIDLSESEHVLLLLGLQ